MITLTYGYLRTNEGAKYDIQSFKNYFILSIYLSSHLCKNKILDGFKQALAKVMKPWK